MTEPTAAPAQKLRPLKTVAEAYRFFFARLPQVARICSGWLGISAAFLAGSIALFARLMESNSQAAIRFQSMPQDKQASAMVGLPILVLLLAAPLIVVAWHHVIILATTPGILPFSLGRAILYLARSFLLGVIWPLTLGLVGLLPIVYVGRLEFDPALAFALKAGLVVFAAVVGIVITARFLLVLPAGAVGDWAVDLSKSWHLTAGNGLRLGLGFILAAAPVFAINAATQIFFHAVEDQAVTTRTAVVVIVISVLLSLVAALIEATFLSFAYLFFTRVERPRTPINIDDHVT